MYLAKLKLWNFRKFGSENEFDLDNPHLEVDFTEGLNVLIGPNDSGKTAIIDSIKHVLKTHSSEYIRLTVDDFYNKENRLRIECIFEDLNDEEAKHFLKWLGVEEQENGEDRVYLRVFLDAEKKDGEIMSYEIKAGVEDEGYRLVGGARKYLRTTYLKPLRNAKEELVSKRGSRLSQILRGHKIFKDEENREELVKKFEDFSEKIKDYFEEGEGEGPIKDKLEDFLLDFFGEKRGANLSIPDRDFKEIIENLELSLEEEKLGLGSHNLLFMAAELLNLRKNDWDGLRLGLIEELEAHLHPQSQLRMVKTLEDKSNVQFVLTTHSPNLASKIDLKNLIICGNSINTDDNSDIKETEGLDKKTKKPEVFPIGPKDSSFTKLKPNDYKFLERFLDVTKSNLFFSEGVIMVEGWSEELLIPAIAKHKGLSLTKQGITVVNVAGTSFLRYSKIFQRKELNKGILDIPVSVVRDLDIKQENKDEYKQKVNERREEFDGQLVETFCSIKQNLEYSLARSEILGSEFKEVVKDIHSGTDWSNFTEKLKEKGSDFLNKTEIAYRLAQRIEEDHEEEREIDFEDYKSDSISYIIDAIKYASREY
ncbi:MAG: ATP-dependent endonuclease [Candidatus Magasanikbacteria bacterium]